MQNKKINIVTLGCSKNIVDSEKLMKQLQSGGYDLVCDSGDTSASTVIINTCGFINDANIENLFVMGCLSERYMDTLKNEIPEVSRYFGVNSIDDILSEMGMSLKENLLTERTLTGPGHYAYLKVSEGCDRACAFCAIPIIRGRCISRPIESLIEEASILAQRGVKELILIAQDLSYYGLDLYKSQKLPELLTEFLKIESIEWIRLHYLYPAGFPLKLILLIFKRLLQERISQIEIQVLNLRFYNTY